MSYPQENLGRREASVINNDNNSNTRHIPQRPITDFFRPTAPRTQPQNPYHIARAHTRIRTQQQRLATTRHIDLTIPEFNQEYGDSIHSKIPHHFRHFGGNINGIQATDQFLHAADIGLKAINYQANGISLIETNVDFNHNSSHHVIRSKLAPAWEKKINMASTTSDRSFGSYYQPGGMCQAIGGPWITRISASTSDPSGLGQWTYQTLQGQQARQISIITAYQTCQGSDLSGEKTTWRQRQSLISQMSEKDTTQTPNPRNHFAKDMTHLCNTLQTEDHSIILFIDANSDILDNRSWLQKFIRDTSLIDAFTHRHGSTLSFATHKRGTCRIDYMFISESLLPYMSSCGYLEFDGDSDHRPMFLDVDATSFLRDKAPPDLPNTTPRAIMSRFKKLSRLYKKSAIKSMTDQMYHSRTSILFSKVINQDYQLQSEDKVEIESLDHCITHAMVTSEQEFTSTHNTPWSPPLIRCIHVLQYWSAWISEIRTGKDLSARRDFRLRESLKAGAPIEGASSTPPNISDARQHQRQSRRQLRLALKNAAKIREEWLLEQEDLARSTDNSKRVKILQNIRRSEITRISHQTVRQTLKGRTGGALSYLHTTDPITGSIHTIFEPTEMESKLMQRNLDHFHQADGTPFTSQQMQDICSESYIDAIAKLQDISHQESQATSAVIQELSQSLAHPDSQMGLIDGEDLAGKFRKWKEATSTSPSHRHLGLYKAILKADNPTLNQTNDDATATSDLEEPDHGAIFFHCLATIINICVKSGYVLTRWKKVVSLMLEKIPGKPLIEKLRVIHIYEADFNAWAGIVFGRRMMKKAELIGALGEEQGGSRKGRNAADVYAMKALSFQMAELTKTPLAVMDNDAKACYDRIVMGLALLRCEQLGIPHDACQLFEHFLSTAEYHISTSLGVSTENYSSSPIWKLHGPGQGHQSSPAIWAVISTLILNIVKTKFSGTTYHDPTQQQSICHHMQTFVDDSSIWINDFSNSLLNVSSTEDIVNQLTIATQWWENLLVTTGGKLELNKCFFYLIHWRFNKEGVAELNDAPVQTPMNIIQSTDQTVHTIEQKDPFTAHRTLGFQAKPVNDFKEQLKVLLEKSSSVTRALYTHSLDPSTAQRAYTSVFLPSVTYPMTLCGLSQTDLNKVQSGPLSCTLRSMNYPQTIPRAMVFLSTSEGGLGFSSLFTEQGIQNVLFILRHLRQRSNLGNFLRIVLSWFQVVAGVQRPILEDTHRNLPQLTSKWITNLRKFLANLDGTITIDGVNDSPTQREKDCHLMDLAFDLFTKDSQIQQINRVRLYLRVTRLSDISTALGTELIFPHSFQPSPTDFPSSSPDLWPVQPKPGNRSWTTWRSFLNHITSDGKRLRQKLGPWNTQVQTRLWKTCLDPDSCQVFINRESHWESYDATATSRGITLDRRFTHTSHTPPQYYAPLDASPRQKFDYVCPPILEIPPTPGHPTTWSQYISTLPPWEHDLLRHSLELPSSERLLKFLHTADRTLHLVSDGGCKSALGSFGWVIASETEILWRGWGVARGTPMSSYRAEAYGRLASVRFFLRYTEYLEITHCQDMSVETACDNDSLIKTEKHWRHIQIPNSYAQLQPDADVVQMIVASYKGLPSMYRHSHIKGHQDSTTRISELPWVAQLNVAADKLATYALSSPTMQQDSHIFFPIGDQTYLSIQKRTITSSYKSQIRKYAGSNEGRTYLCRKLKSTARSLDSINWQSYRLARQRLPPRMQAFVSKRLCNWLPTNERKNKHSPEISAQCPHCNHSKETFDHVLKCPAMNSWRSDFHHNLTLLLESLNTPTDLFETIVTTTRDWLGSQSLSNEPSLWLKGCLPMDWTNEMNLHLRSTDAITKTRTGESWATKLCHFIFTSTHKAWCTRSKMVDEQRQTVHEKQERQRMIAEMTQLYSLKPECILRYPFAIALELRSTFSNDHISSWLQNHKLNLLRSHSRWKESQLYNPQRDIRTFFAPRTRG